MQASINGISLTTTNIQLPSLNGWNNYGTYTVRNVTVTANGMASLLLNFVNPNLNLNWIEFAPTSVVAQASGASLARLDLGITQAIRFPMCSTET